jgi:hypothetical protein
MDVDQLIRVYIKIRDAKEAKQREMEEAVAALETQLDMIGQQLLEICKATGQDGGKAPSGSFSRSIKTRYWTGDWDHMYKFIRDNDAPELLERRLHQGNFKEFLVANPDKMPEGVNVEAKYSITVRRAR